MNETKRDLLDRRLVLGQFCDDVRLEVGHKLSFIGCYDDEMIVRSFPATLPKLAAQVQAITPLQCPFERLTFKLNLQSSTLAQIDVPISDLSQFAKIAQRGSARWIRAAAVMVVSPLVVTQECELTLLAETESGLIRGSVLRVRGAAQIPPKRAARAPRQARRKRSSPSS